MTRSDSADAASAHRGFIAASQPPAARAEPSAGAGAGHLAEVRRPLVGPAAAILTP